MNITVLIDEEAFDPEDPQFEVGNEESLTSVEYHVTETLRDLGHHSTVIPFEGGLAEMIQRLEAQPTDLVFNLTEHYRGDRGKDKNIAAMLELLGIPFTGAGPIGLMLCRDKAMCKRVLSHYRVVVPGFTMLPPGKTRVQKKLQYPLIVKPGYEDGSDGISLGSLVHDERELADRVTMIHERMRQPAICEEYIDGREIYVGITGNKRLSAYPAREVRFNDPNAGPRFATSRVKLDEAYRQKWGIEFTEANLPTKLAERAGRIGKQIYRMLHLRDYGRIDMRITAQDEIVFLEANPNPDLTMGDEVAEAARVQGVSYEALIDRIVKLAMQRA